MNTARLKRTSLLKVVLLAAAALLAACLVASLGTQRSDWSHRFDGKFLSPSHHRPRRD